MLHADVRQRDVVLRVVRYFPDVAGAGRVEDQSVVEVASHPAWCGLDPAPLSRHLRIVPIGIHGLGNHWCSYPTSSAPFRCGGGEARRSPYRVPMVGASGAPRTDRFESRGTVAPTCSAK